MSFKFSNKLKIKNQQKWFHSGTVNSLEDLKELYFHRFWNWIENDHFNSIIYEKPEYYFQTNKDVSKLSLELAFKLLNKYLNNSNFANANLLDCLAAALADWILEAITLCYSEINKYQNSQNIQEQKKYLKQIENKYFNLTWDDFYKDEE